MDVMGNTTEEKHLHALIFTKNEGTGPPTQTPLPTTNMIQGQETENLRVYIDAPMSIGEK